MSAVEIILGIAVILVSLFIIAVVLLQQGHRAGINGAISGGADTFLSKNKARTFDASLARWTKWVAVAFFVLAIVFRIGDCCKRHCFEGLNIPRRTAANVDRL